MRARTLLIVLGVALEGALGPCQGRLLQFRRQSAHERQRRCDGPELDRDCGDARKPVVSGHRARRPTTGMYRALRDHEQ